MAQVTVVFTLDFPEHDDIAVDVAHDFATDAISQWRDRFWGENYSLDSLSLFRESEDDESEDQESAEATFPVRVWYDETSGAS